jgi:hypothetical protein
MAEPTTPEYDRFADEARAAVAAQQRVVAAYQGLAKVLLEREGTEGRDVRAGEPD